MFWIVYIIPLSCHIKCVVLLKRSLFLLEPLIRTYSRGTVEVHVMTLGLGSRLLNCFCIVVPGLFLFFSGFWFWFSCVHVCCLYFLSFCVFLPPIIVFLSPSLYHGANFVSLGPHGGLLYFFLFSCLLIQLSPVFLCVFSFASFISNSVHLFSPGVSTLPDYLRCVYIVCSLLFSSSFTPLWLCVSKFHNLPCVPVSFLGSFVLLTKENMIMVMMMFIIIMVYSALLLLG